MHEPGSSFDAAHARNVVGGVMRAALQESGARGIVLLEAAGPEGRLAFEWLAGAIGRDRVVAGPATVGHGDGTIDAMEGRRAAARVLARQQSLLLAHPACKTVLLLSSDVPPERLLPLGDVYASDLAAVAGDVTLPDPVRQLAEGAGGVDRLDAALRSWLEDRLPLGRAMAVLPEDVGKGVVERLRRNRAHRRWPRCVPKLGRRTLWIDLFA